MWITVSEYADKFNLTKQAVYKKVNNKKLKTKKNKDGVLTVFVRNNTNDEVIQPEIPQVDITDLVSRIGRLEDTVNLQNQRIYDLESEIKEMKKVNHL
jgi:predicted DNA-binding protein YlxM (UPF0122 family)